MPKSLPLGTYRTINAGGLQVPYYIIPFDKRGLCEGPRTRDELVKRVSEEGFTDVFVFSHGWNNAWPTAIDRYEGFIRGFLEMREDEDIPSPAGYKPILVGIFWPSTALVTEDEQAPDIAAVPGAPNDTEVAEERRQIEEIAAKVSEDDLEAFYLLADKDEWDEAEAIQFAGMVRSIYESPDEIDDEVAPDPEEIVAAWSAAQDVLAPDFDDDVDRRTDYGTADDSRGAGPAPAGIGDLFKRLDPRNVVRMLTVYQMKDRAGTVGTRGVAPLVDSLLGARQRPRLHLIGHSYGGKVVLSATAGLQSDRKVHSMLLLQPAVNHLCFADRVPGTDRPGGYHSVPDKVEKPIFSTFSEHDFPLTKTFHLALRRGHDAGEMRIAAAGEPPSKFAALGGFGPRGADERLRSILDPGDSYPELAQDPAPEIVGIDGSRTIDGHGDVSNESTWWALHQLVGK